MSLNQKIYLVFQKHRNESANHV